MEKENTFDPDLVHEIFKLVWKRKAAERGKNELSENIDNEVGASSSKRIRPTFGKNLANALFSSQVAIMELQKPIAYLKKGVRHDNRAAENGYFPWTMSYPSHVCVSVLMIKANANALKLSSELLRVFVAEAIQRAATIAEAEGSVKIEATHLERILPQLLLDF
uniref:Centromere protein X n=2 Tax=Solanum TaxID=4107 RepID=A0A3Q7FRS4_SOLLC